MLGLLFQRKRSVRIQGDQDLITCTPWEQKGPSQTNSFLSACWITRSAWGFCADNTHWRTLVISYWGPGTCSSCLPCNQCPVATSREKCSTNANNVQKSSAGPCAVDFSCPKPEVEEKSHCFMPLPRGLCSTSAGTLPWWPGFSPWFLSQGAGDERSEYKLSAYSTACRSGSPSLPLFYPGRNWSRVGAQVLVGGEEQSWSEPLWVRCWREEEAPYGVYSCLSWPSEGLMLESEVQSQVVSEATVDLNGRNNIKALSL